MKSPIDFTLLCDNAQGYAVHCQTEEEAELFLEWAKRLYPGYCNSWEDTKYDDHEENTIYTFDSDYGNGKWFKGGLRYGSMQAAIDIGYTIIEFADIYKPAEIVEGDQPISLLIGGCK